MDEPRRSIQDLIPPARSKPVRPVVQKSASTEMESTIPPSNLPPNPRERRTGGMIPLFAIAFGVIVILAIGFGIVSTVFHRATVTVTLKTMSVPVSGSFEASPTGANLAFALKTDTETLSKTVASTGSQHVSESASGTITVHNAGSTSQKLIATTRFQSPDGHIYRIRTAVSVPASKSVDVTVYADQPGDTYNLKGPADLTLPGLKGSPQFTSVTGHLAGSIAGGFVGDKAVVSDAIHAQAVDDLSKQLTDKATAALNATLGADDVIIPGSITTSFVADPDQPGGAGAIITLHGTASAAVFSMAALARIIAADGGSVATGPMIITNLADLSPAVAPSKTPGNLTLTLSGTASLKGSYDQEALLQNLAGKSRKDVGPVLSSYPGIEDMKMSVYPFWSNALPTDPGKISLKENLDAAP